MGVCPIPSERARPNECTRGHAHPNTRAHTHARIRYARATRSLRARNTEQHGRHGGAADPSGTDRGACRALEVTGSLEGIQSELRLIEVLKSCKMCGESFVDSEKSRTFAA